MTLPPQPPSDPNARTMKRWLPPIWYDQAQTVNAVLEGEGEQLTQFQADVAAVNSARMPQTSPDWACTRWEQELGLTVAPPGMSLIDRQNRILARFRGIGTTIYRLKTIASTFGYGSISIQPGIEDWTLYIGFTDLYGVPPNLDAHQSEIRNNVEAHLGLVWAFHFTLWQEVKNTGVLWCQLLTAGVPWDGPGGIKTTPWQNLPTAVECAGEPAGTIRIEVLDSTSIYTGISLRYSTPQITGNVTGGTTDPLNFPIT